MTQHKPLLQWAVILVAVLLTVAVCRMVPPIEDRSDIPGVYGIRGDMIGKGSE